MVRSILGKMKKNRNSYLGSCIILKRAIQLIKRLGQSIDLYLAFYQCDNETGDKESDNFIWFNEVCEDFKAK